MSEKKELNKEQLEKVSGGNVWPNKYEVVWLYSKDAIVQVKLEGGTTTVDGKVTKRGVFGNYGGVIDCYYLENETHTNINGWYSSLDIVNNVVDVNKKLANITDNYNEVAW